MLVENRNPFLTVELAKNYIPLFGRKKSLGERCCNDEWCYSIILALLQVMHVMGVDVTVRAMYVAKEGRMTNGWEDFCYGYNSNVNKGPIVGGRGS
jgi:hypothetical protein